MTIPPLSTKASPRLVLAANFKSLGGELLIGSGWDEGRLDTETTPIMLLSRARWEQEIERYKLGSADFKINPATDIVIIE